MKTADWVLNQDDGELRILTGVAGPAAKMGHRLTIAMQSWQATVAWADDEPAGAELVVDVDSLQVLNGEGGVTPLSGPEKVVVRANALKSLDVKKHPMITFRADTIVKTDTGYQLDGPLQIHGKTRNQVVELAVDDTTDAWVLSAQVPVTQTEFGVKPYSLLMGSMKVADEVTISFTATRAKVIGLTT